MDELLKKEKDFVVPGDEIVKSMNFLPGRNSFREGESIFAKRIGLVSLNHSVISVVPLNSVYIPRVGDVVIGKVDEIQSNGWNIEINAPSQAYMPLAGVREYIDTTKSSLSRYYDVNDLIYAKVSSMQGDSIYLSMHDIKAKKFRGGRIVPINPAKVPRLIGKQGSMINMIKDKTGCRINVGQNGFVWLEGDNVELAVKAIDIIQKESYREGLTDRVAEFLEKLSPTPKKVEEKSEKPKEEKPEAKEKPKEKKEETEKKEVS
jgi:exosome complex component RRP4